MERRKFTKMRTGRQSYEMQGLIFFLAGNYKHLPPELREIVRASCRAAASATTLDRMVRVFFVEMERRLTEAWKR